MGFIFRILMYVKSEYSIEIARPLDARGLIIGLLPKQVRRNKKDT